MASNEKKSPPVVWERERERERNAKQANNRTFSRASREALTRLALLDARIASLLVCMRWNLRRKHQAALVLVRSAMSVWVGWVCVQSWSWQGTSDTTDVNLPKERRESKEKRIVLRRTRNKGWVPRVELLIRLMNNYTAMKRSVYITYISTGIFVFLTRTPRLLFIRLN